MNNIIEQKHNNLYMKSISLEENMVRIKSDKKLFTTFTNINFERYKRCFNNVLNFELSNMRSAFPKRKNVSTTSGSGRKIRPQKRTGRARLGSIRGNQMRGGGSCFGEQITIHYKKINKKEFNNAVFFLLHYRDMYGVNFNIKEYSTSRLHNIFLKQLKLQKLILIFSFQDLDKYEMLIRSFSNLNNSTVMYIFDITLFALYTFQNIILLPHAATLLFDRLNNRLLHTNVRKNKHKKLVKYIF